MQLSAPNAALTWFLRLVTFALVVAMLSVGRDVLMPIAFAMLFVILLTPAVIRFRSWGVPRVVAILLTVALAGGAIGVLGWFVSDQAIRLAEKLPGYEQTLHHKIAELREPHMPPSMVRLATLLDRLGRDLAVPKLLPAENQTATGSEPRPVPVEVHETKTSAFGFVRDLVLPLLRPLAMAGIVVVFIIAMLFQREDLRDRFIRLAGAGRISLTTEAVEDASRRVSRYLGMQLVVNAIYGLPIGIGLYFIGVPNAALWGLLSTLLRFVPYLGAWIAAAFPVALSVMIDPGWSMLLWTTVLFVTVELISNYIVEVLIYSGTTGISNLALLVAAAFWTWLWGPGGLILSTPLTVGVLVMGKYVPGLRGLSMLLGSEPALDPAAQFYQRMLSRESEHLLDLASRYIAEHSLEQFYEAVFVPALLLAEEDRHSGALADARQGFIVESSRDLLEELERADDKLSGAEPDAGRALIVGFAARDDADELVARALGHLLRRAGCTVELFPRGTELEHAFAHLPANAVPIAFISALPPSALLGARQMCRRLRVHRPDISLLVGIWSPSANAKELEPRLAMTPPVGVVVSLSAAVTQLLATSRPDAAAMVPVK